MYRVYIDEAGDRGHRPGSSTHFIVAAVVVRDEYDAVVRGQLTALRTQLGRQPGHTLHFRKLTHSQKVKACQEIAGFSADMITTVTMVKPRFNEPLPGGGETYLKNANAMYLWSVRLALERISWYVGKHGGGPTIVTFGHLTRFPAEKLHDYRRALEYLGGATQIRWAVYSGHPFRIDHPNNIELLQLADAAASALFKAVEPDQYGNTETRYLEALAPKLYRRGSSSVTSYGLKVFPKGECEKGGSLESLRSF
jgi:hypothetical protein